MAFIVPKTLAHRVAEGIAQGCNDGKPIPAEDIGAILATSEAILAKLADEAAAAEAEYKKTEEGMAKAAVACWAGKARLLTIAMLDQQTKGSPQSEQARKGTKVRKDKDLVEVARVLRQALIRAGMDPRQYVPADGKPTKSAPAAVVILNMAEATVALAARPRIQAARAA